MDHSVYELALFSPSLGLFSLLCYFSIFLHCGCQESCGSSSFLNHFLLWNSRAVNNSTFFFLYEQDIVGKLFHPT